MSETIDPRPRVSRLAYVTRQSAERQARYWARVAPTPEYDVVVGDKEHGRYPLIWVPKTPQKRLRWVPVTPRNRPIVIDPAQPEWSTSHAATVLTYSVGTTVKCDCGSSYHAPTKEEAEDKWERHVLAARSR